MKPLLNLLMNPDSDATMEDVACKLSGAIFALKRSTALSCWMEHVKPLEANLQDMSQKYITAKEMFHDSRAAYLREVAHLRDTARCRTAASSDIVWFFEPTSMLNGEEKKFMLDAIKEKLKMIYEN